MPSVRASTARPPVRDAVPIFEITVFETRDGKHRARIECDTHGCYTPPTGELYLADLINQAVFHMRQLRNPDSVEATCPIYETKEEAARKGGFYRRRQPHLAAF